MQLPNPQAAATPFPGQRSEGRRADSGLSRSKIRVTKRTKINIELDVNALHVLILKGSVTVATAPHVGGPEFRSIASYQMKIAAKCMQK